MEVLLDTNFIISSLDKKINFIEQLQNLGFKPIVPKEVIEELKDLKKNSKVSQKRRTFINLALKLLSDKKIKKISFGGRKVDEALIEKGRNEGIYIASLDAEVRRSVPNRIIINSAKKRVEIERK